MKNDSGRPPNRLTGLIKAILKYPFKISGKYSSYNKGISDLIAVKNDPLPYDVAGDEYFRNIQKKNSKLVWGFIYSPLFVGLLVAMGMMYLNKDRYINYVNKVSAPITEERFIKRVSGYINKAVYIVVDQPFSIKDLTPFLIGYFLSILGANLCSKNPTFEHEAEIKRRFLAMGCTDIEGNPWRVVWTLEALLITSFGRDPNQLNGDAKFWHSINFPPSMAKISSKDMNKFVVQKKYELSGNMEIKLEADDGRK
jgi:hypothetical protein